MNKKLCLDDPNIGELEKRSVCDAIDKGYVSTFGPFVTAFEERFTSYLGAKKAVSTQSGTAALYMALYETGIGKGDEVIVPALTFIATANPVMYVGAKPVFVDVDPKTWVIDPREIERHITNRTKAIIPVHFYGNPCDMEKIVKIARRHGLYVIEDATESLGATYKGRYTGTFGDFGCFSFNGNKIITTGGGGMVIGGDAKKMGHIRFLVNQAKDESKGYFHSEIGFNFRMTNIEASLGLAQMERLDAFLAKKRRFAEIYVAELKDADAIHFQEEYEFARSSYWFTCISFDDGIDVASIQERLKKKGIPTRRVFMPVPEFPPYEVFKKEAFENSYSIYERGLCLPASTVNRESDIHVIAKVIRRLVGA